MWKNRAKIEYEDFFFFPRFCSVYWRKRFYGELTLNLFVAWQGKHFDFVFLSVKKKRKEIKKKNVKSVASVRPQYTFLRSLKRTEYSPLSVLHHKGKWLSYIALPLNAESFLFIICTVNATLKSLVKANRAIFCLTKFSWDFYKCHQVFSKSNIKQTSLSVQLL